MSDERRYVDELECDRRIREQSAKVEAYYKTDRDRWKALAGRALDVVDLLSPHADMYGTDEQRTVVEAILSDPTGQRALAEWQEMRRQVAEKHKDRKGVSCDWHTDCGAYDRIAELNEQLSARDQRIAELEKLVGRMIPFVGQPFSEELRAALATEK
jgi:hypothetical protein